MVGVYYIFFIVGFVDCRRGLLKEVSIIGGAKRNSIIAVSIIGGFFNGVYY